MHPISETAINTFSEQLRKHGEEGFFHQIVDGWLSLPVDSNQIDNSELEPLKFSDTFFSMYRRTGNEEYFILGKIFRRAAHKIYRANLSRNKLKGTNPNNFLNLLKKPVDSIPNTTTYSYISRTDGYGQ